METGFPISSSKKQNLKTISSTDSWIVGVDDFMPSIFWKRNFLKTQDYDVTENILLEKNGKSSVGKRTQNINIQFFL